MRRPFAWIIAVSAFALFPRAGEACSCAGPHAPCEAAWQVDAVFVAQVVRVERTSTHIRAHLMPLETFRGPSDILSIDTGLGGGDCGYSFQPGEAYLIYARGDKAGRYSTGICNRTRPLSQAAEDLDYLRTTARTPSNLGVLRGIVVRTDTNYGGASQRNPHPGIRVVVRGKGVQEERQTDANGRYELLLPPGEYEVKAEAPEGLYATTLLPVQLRNARGCAEANISLASDGRVRGRVVDARGQPLAGLPVELVTRVFYGFTRAGQPVATGTDGTYEFTRVPPGTFYVAFDTLRRDLSRRVQERVFAPGTLDPAAAAAIVLAPAERVTAADLVLPDAAGAVRLAGQVRTPDGQPVEGARVYLRVAPPTSIFFFGPPAVSGQSGEFALMVPGDQVYDVTVELLNDQQRTRGLKLTARPAQGDRWLDIVIPALK